MTEVLRKLNRSMSTPMLGYCLNPSFSLACHLAQPKRLTHSTMKMHPLTQQYLSECRDALSTEQARSLSATNNWAHVNRQQVHADWDALYKELAPLLECRAPDSVEVQALIERHYCLVSRFYAPSKEAYIGMSLFYGEDPAMRSFHEAHHISMVEFLAEAIPIYAQKHL